MRVIFLLMSVFYCCDLSAERIVPPALQKGDLIALVFPASQLDKSIPEAWQVILKKQKWLHERGYLTAIYPKKIQLNGYLAGTDYDRANALMAAWRNPKVKAIWCFRGGYGTQRLLDSLDFEWIKNHPKIFIGMSDITALHHAIQSKTGLVTFLGPVLNYFDETDSPFDAPYAIHELEQMIGKSKTKRMQMPNSMEFKVIRPGKAQGELVGGNLCLIASLCGTKWQMDTRGKILVLEDVGEEIYRIDRLLWQLKESGLLEHPAAVILGSWKDCKSALKNSLTLEEVFTHYFGNAKYPVIADFPCGHDKFQTTVPLHTLAEVDTAANKVRLLEPPVQ